MKQQRLFIGNYYVQFRVMFRYQNVMSRKSRQLIACLIIQGVTFILALQPVIWQHQCHRHKHPRTRVAQVRLWFNNRTRQPVHAFKGDQTVSNYQLYQKHYNKTSRQKQVSRKEDYWILVPILLKTACYVAQLFSLGLRRTWSCQSRKRNLRMLLSNRQDDRDSIPRVSTCYFNLPRTVLNSTSCPAVRLFLLLTNKYTVPIRLRTMKLG